MKNLSLDKFLDGSVGFALKLLAFAGMAVVATLLLNVCVEIFKFTVRSPEHYDKAVVIGPGLSETWNNVQVERLSNGQVVVSANTFKIVYSDGSWSHVTLVRDIEDLEEQKRLESGKK